MRTFGSRFVLVGVLFILLCISWTCFSASVRDMAEEIAADVGQIQALADVDSDRLIFIFEERLEIRAHRTRFLFRLRRLLDRGATEKRNPKEAQHSYDCASHLYVP